MRFLGKDVRDKLVIVGLMGLAVAVIGCAKKEELAEEVKKKVPATAQERETQAKLAKEKAALQYQQAEKEYEKGVSYYDDGRYEKALKIFREILKKYPKLDRKLASSLLEQMVKIADEYYSSGQYRQAAELYQEVTYACDSSLLERDKPLWFLSSETKYSEKELVAKAKCFQSVWCRRSGECEKATALCEEVIASLPSTPESGQARALLAVICYSEQNKVRQAYQHILAAEKDYPSSKPIKRFKEQLALAYEKLKVREERESKIAKYKEVIETNSSNQEAAEAGHKLAALYLESKDYDRAIEIYTGMIVTRTSAKEAARAQYRLAELYLEKRDYKKAVEEFQKVVNSYPEDNLAPKAQLEIAKIYQDRLPDKEKMVEAYEQTIAKFPHTWEAARAHHELGEIYLAEKDVEKAYKHTMERKKVIDRVIAKHREGIEANPSGEETARIHYKIGELYLGKKDYKKAIEELQKVADNYPQDEIAPRAQFEIGKIYGDRLNNEKKMIEAYEKLMISYPSHELAFKALDIINQRGKKK